MLLAYLLHLFLVKDLLLLNHHQGAFLGESRYLRHLLLHFLYPYQSLVALCVGGLDLRLQPDVLTLYLRIFPLVIGVVLTERLTVNNMSVNELVGMGRSPYTGFWGRMSDYDRMVVREAISLVGIEPLRGRMVQTLSDGERQKVMIAKALAQETPVIFLDEPTAFLDYPSKVEIMQLLQTLSRERDKTVFLSTHDLELALQIADKVWLLDKPHGVTIGTPEDLALKGEMTKYFHREGVSFDIESGLFKIEHRLTQMITLEGNGPVADMIRKALARHGVAVTHEENENIIYVDDSEIRLNGDTYPDIDSLLEAVDTLFDCR